MDHISWFDAFRATASSCFPCFPTSHHTTNTPHLASLLSPDSDTDDISLHSHLGSRQSRKHARKPRADLTVFGYKLFGSNRIHLPEDEHDGLLGPRSGTASFDSDAASLDPAPEQIARMAREEEAGRRKAERRRRRRERREMTRLAGGSTDEFEGFQGSGDNAAIPSPVMLHSPDSDDEADLDGSTYTQSLNSPASNPASSSSASSGRKKRIASPAHSSPAAYPSPPASAS